jgi:four helix bundle protein
MKSYRELEVWKQSMDLAERVYALSRLWPKEETYGLTSQVRRAAVSVPSNIAEGSAKQTTGEFLQALGHAKGSLAEVETQLLLAERFGYLAGEDAAAVLGLCDAVSRMLSGLDRSLRARKERSGG